MVDILSERMYAAVSAQTSAGDGIIIDTMIFQPPASAASSLMHSMAELWRRAFTHIISPSATLISGGSAGSVALTAATAGPSGIWGLCQGMPFFLSGVAISGAPMSSVSTASYQIRKVLVTIPISSFGQSGPSGSSLAGTATLQFIYGSAMNTSTLACTSGGQGVSYFDMVPLPLPSANEVPVGWLNIPNSFATSAGLNASHMFNDYRVMQGYNLSNILAARVQP